MELQLLMNKDLHDKQLKIINENINVGKESQIKEFFIMLGGVVAICFCIFIFSDCMASIFVNFIPYKTQTKIEQALSFNNKIDSKIVNDVQIDFDSIVKKIVKVNKKLKKSDFKIFLTNEKEINAYVAPDGSIFITKRLLDEIKNNEDILTFIIAHEIGHYHNRDHLKGFSREIVLSAFSVILFSDVDMSGISNSILELNRMKHSQKQEEKADEFANKTIKRIYGSNDGAVKFFEMLIVKEKSPEFLYYFSTHPSPKKRIQKLHK